MRPDRGTKLECRTCGRSIRYDGSHRTCAPCRYQRKPGTNAVKRACPICGGIKARQSDYCGNCWRVELIQAKERLQARASDPLTHRILTESREARAKLYDRPKVHRKPNVAPGQWTNPHGFVIRADGSAYIPDA